MPSSRRRRWPRPTASFVPAAACSSSICASTAKHGCEQKLGDRWLGFADRTLRDLLTGAGFHEVVVNVGARRAGDPFTVLVARGCKSGKRHGARGSDTAGKTRGSTRGKNAR